MERGPCGEFFTDFSTAAGDDRNSIRAVIQESLSNLMRFLNSIAVKVQRCWR
jgi:hypothetical protein